MLPFNGEKIAQALQAYTAHQQARFAGLHPTQDSQKLRASAVMMPLIQKDGHWHLLLTHRSDNLMEHRGQVAFPGGSREAGDRTLEETALREMQEEIGVHPQDVEVFGSLGEMPVLTGYLVRVFVGRIPWPYALTINPDEVESAFIVPLQWLVDPDHRTVRYRNFAGREIPVIYFDLYEGHQLWGASAEMTLALLEALKLVD